eukprot:Gregarina_sp_Poly_1__1457@NODE_1365_length_4288_cov_73_759536_g913_i0_p1_GENE_NODE_1365_length_4288_cov_73_759536_g913_i0NODE_1365_length_4288_cov_73_759536_g913_i0_p1_ORF_typecomplete_len944_score138_97NatB_MDM20/PF09797_9/3_6e02NatB_MDM20/PF09797_9/0_0039DUF627/PF04781_12/0_0061PI_PP_I/PF18363_1/1e04PI_PP_I/PF18363_1/0_14TPR_19/PF14559_6/0_3TPR_19/PF14559_6/1_6e04DUF445/PF04286_12/5_3e03DUF445/PF04286_12/0_4_NODE_1365_length_4288_cov_73_759536_g913_i03023133
MLPKRLRPLLRPRNRFNGTNVKLCDLFIRLKLPRSGAQNPQFHRRQNDFFFSIMIDAKEQLCGVPKRTQRQISQHVAEGQHRKALKTISKARQEKPQCLILKAFQAAVYYKQGNRTEEITLWIHHFLADCKKASIFISGGVKTEELMEIYVSSICQILEILNEAAFSREFCSAIADICVSLGHTIIQANEVVRDHLFAGLGYCLLHAMVTGFAPGKDGEEKWSLSSILSKISRVCKINRGFSNGVDHIWTDKLREFWATAVEASLDLTHRRSQISVQLVLRNLEMMAQEWLVLKQTFSKPSEMHQKWRLLMSGFYWLRCFTQVAYWESLKYEGRIIDISMDAIEEIFVEAANDMENGLAALTYFDLNAWRVDIVDALLSLKYAGSPPLQKLEVALGLLSTLWKSPIEALSYGLSKMMQLIGSILADLKSEDAQPRLLMFEEEIQNLKELSADDRLNIWLTLIQPLDPDIVDNSRETLFFRLVQCDFKISSGRAILNYLRLHKNHELSKQFLAEVKSEVESEDLDPWSWIKFCRTLTFAASSGFDDCHLGAIAKERIQREFLNSLSRQITKSELSNFIEHLIAVRIDLILLDEMEKPTCDFDNRVRQSIDLIQTFQSAQSTVFLEHIQLMKYLMEVYIGELQSAFETFRSLEIKSIQMESLKWVRLAPAVKWLIASPYLTNIDEDQEDMQDWFQTMSSVHFQMLGTGVFHRAMSVVRTYKMRMEDEDTSGPKGMFLSFIKQQHLLTGDEDSSHCKPSQKQLEVTASTDAATDTSSGRLQSCSKLRMIDNLDDLTMFGLVEDRSTKWDNTFVPCIGARKRHPMTIIKQPELHTRRELTRNEMDTDKREGGQTVSKAAIEYAGMLAVVNELTVLCTEAPAATEPVINWSRQIAIDIKQAILLRDEEARRQLKETLTSSAGNGIMDRQKLNPFLSKKLLAALNVKKC